MNQPTQFPYSPISRFNKVVIWGLKTQYHTHRYIHKGFFGVLKKLGVPVVWTDYSMSKTSIIEKGDLVISSKVQGKGVKDCFVPIKPGVYYCLHNFEANITGQLETKQFINLQVYTNASETADQKWDSATLFNSKTRTLYQPWGTNLLPEEFKAPTFNKNSRVFWVGSVWDNQLHQGNIDAIAELKASLASRGLKFNALRFVPDWLNVALIRYSRLAPAVAGRWQVENNYLPCRMFKNISYGQLGFSNVKKFDDLLGFANIHGQSITELTDKVLALSKSDYLSIINQQQAEVKKQTYAQKLLNICRALEQ